MLCAQLQLQATRAAMATTIVVVVLLSVSALHGRAAVTTATRSPSASDETSASKSQSPSAELTGTFHTISNTPSDTHSASSERSRSRTYSMSGSTSFSRTLSFPTRSPSFGSVSHNATGTLSDSPTQQESVTFDTSSMTVAWTVSTSRSDPTPSRSSTVTVWRSTSVSPSMSASRSFSEEPTRASHSPSDSFTRSGSMLSSATASDSSSETGSSQVSLSDSESPSPSPESTLSSTNISTETPTFTASSTPTRTYASATELESRSSTITWSPTTTATLSPTQQQSVSWESSSLSMSLSPSSSTSQSEESSVSSTPSQSPQRGRAVSSTLQASNSPPVNSTDTTTATVGTPTHDHTTSASASSSSTVSLTDAESQTRSGATPTQSLSSAVSPSSTPVHTKSPSLMTSPTLTDSPSSSASRSSSPTTSNTHHSPSSSWQQSQSLSFSDMPTPSLTKLEQSDTLEVPRTSSRSQSVTAGATRSSTMTEGETITSSRGSHSNSKSASAEPTAAVSVSATPSTTPSWDSPTPNATVSGASPSTTLSDFTPTRNRHRSHSNTTSYSATRELASVTLSRSRDHSLTSSMSYSASVAPTASRSITESFGTPTLPRTNHSFSLSDSDEGSQTVASATATTSPSHSEEVTSTATQSPSPSSSRSATVTLSASIDNSRSPTQTVSPSLSGSETVTQQASVTMGTASSSKEASVSSTPSVIETVTLHRLSATQPPSQSHSRNTPSASPSQAASWSVSVSHTGRPTSSKSLSVDGSTASRSDSGTEEMTETRTTTRIRSLSRKPSMSESTSESATLGTITAEATLERTASSTMGSVTRTKYSKTASPNTNTRSRTMTATEPESATPSATASCLPTVSSTAPSPSSAASASNTVSRRTPTLSTTPSESSTTSLSGSETDSGAFSSSPSATPTNDFSLSPSSSPSHSASSSDTFSSAASATKLSPSPSSSASPLHSISPTATPSSQRSSSRSLSATSSSTLSASPTTTKSLSSDRSTTPTQTPSASNDHTSSETVPQTPTNAASKTTTHSEEITSSGSSSVTPSLSTERSPSQSHSASHSASDSPTADRKTGSRSGTEHWSASRSFTAPPSRSVIRTPSQSAYATDTRTLRRSDTASASPSVTVIVTNTVVSDSPEPTRSRSNSHFSSTGSGSAFATSTETLLFTPSPSDTAEATLEGSLSPSRSTSGASVSVPLPITDSITPSSDVSASLRSMTMTKSLSEIGSRTKTASPSRTMRTPTITQTLLLTEEVTRSETLVLTGTRDQKRSRSRSLIDTVTDTATEARSTTSTLTGLPTTTPSVSRTLQATDSGPHPSTSNTSTEEDSSTTSITLARTGTESITATSSASANITLTTPLTRTHEPTMEGSHSGSDSGSVSFVWTTSMSLSGSVSSTQSWSPSASADVTSTFSVKPTGATHRVTDTKHTASASMSHTPEASSTWTLRQSMSPSPSTDYTLTETSSVSVSAGTRSTTKSVSSMRSASPTKTRSVMSFAISTASVVNPSRTSVREAFTIAIVNAPTTYSAVLDAAYVVLYNGVEGASNNSCAQRVLSLPYNASARPLVFVSANRSSTSQVLSLYFTGIATAIGRYDLCHYSAARREWTWWNLNLLLRPKFRPPQYVFPRGRLVVNASFRLTIGAYGASTLDHMALVLRATMQSSNGTLLCPMTSLAQQGTIAGAFWLTAGPAATNSSFAASGNVLTAGDYALCYHGYPHTEYRLALAFVRVIGAPLALVSTDIAVVATAFQTFRFTIVGLGLSTIDSFLIANGSECTATRVAPVLVHRRVLTPYSAMASLTSVVSDVLVAYPIDNATLCVKSNVSNYYEAMRTIRILENGALGMRPNYTADGNGTAPLVYAEKSVVAVWSVTPVVNGTLTPHRDSMVLCYGSHATCGCVDDPLVAKQRFVVSPTATSTLWTLPSVSRRIAPSEPLLSELWSVCYVTNATRPWRVAPLQQLLVQQYPTEPQVLPFVSVQTSLDVVVQSFNHTIANTVLRMFAAGQSTAGCGAATALPATTVTLTTRTATVDGIARVVATVTPRLVLPMELCIYHTATNATTISSTLRVVPTAPELFHPTRFVVNVSTPVSFAPTDGSVFNFATTSATVVMCPNNTATAMIRVVVDRVLNGTALLLRFTNITQRGGGAIAAGALCFFNPTNGSYIPIPQNGNTFAITSQLTFSAFSTTGALRNVAPVVPTVSATSSFITITIRGVSMYAGEASLATCSTNPSVTFALMSATTAATTTTTTPIGDSTTVDVVTQVWRAYSSVSGNFTLCITYGATTTLTALLEGNTSLSSNSQTTLVFDSSMSSTQQLPAVPHSAFLNHANDYWLVAPTSLDSGARFSAVRLVQYLSSLDDVCSNPVTMNLVLSTAASGTSSELVWRYNSSVLSFARGNVTVCYQSYSTKWYAFDNGAVQPFFMQAAPLPSTLLVSDAQTSTPNQALATCSANVAISGYQVDASMDQFFYYFTTATLATAVCHSSGTPLTITSVVRDTTDLNRLVNITARLVPSQLGSIAICASLGDSNRASPAVTPVLLGIVAVSNPLNITLLPGSSSATFSSSRQTLIASRCISANVLNAPSPVRYNYSIRFVDASNFLPLDDPVATQSFVLLNTPHVAFMVRISAFVLATGSALMSMDSAWIASTSAPTTDTTKLQYCSAFNASNNGATSASTNRFVFSTHVILMKNYVATGCGVFLVDGTLGRERSAVLSAETAQRLLDAEPTLNWDGAYLFPLLTEVYTTSLQVAVSSGYTVTEATNAFAALLAITNPLDDIARGTKNTTEIITSHLSLLSSVAMFVSGAGGATGAAALAPMIVARSQVLGSILCNLTTSSGSTSSMTVGAIALSAQKPETLSSAAAFSIGPSARIVIPRTVGSNVGTSNCVTAMTLPNFIAQGTVSDSSAAFQAQRRHMEVASTGASLLGFNMSTVMVFSDAPIMTAFLALDNSPYARVDALHGYRFYDSNRSSATLSSSAGGTWEAQPASWTPYSYSSSRTLAINITASSSSVARYLVFSGVAEAIYPDVILLKREVATKAVNRSIYWVLLAIVSAHILFVLAAVFYDRYTSAKRYHQTKELLFGIPTPPPRWLQLHRYLSVTTENPISLTAEEYLKVRNESVAGGAPLRSVSHELTMHPLAVLATPSKVHAIAMYWYCLVLATVFVNRESIASQVPFLWDDCVLLGGMAALLARPFAAWTRIAQLRQSQDTASLCSATVAILVAVIAGAASDVETISIVVSMIVLGVATHAVALLVLHARGAGPTPAVVSSQKLHDAKAPTAHLSRVWSLHHLIQVPMLTQLIGALLFLVAWVLSVVLLFFVPYFSSKNPIFTYRPATSTRTSEAEFPYFGRGNPYRLASPDLYTPDTTIAWKTFVLGLVLDATVVEVFVCLASVLWTRAVSWWRVTRHLGPTSGQRVLRMGGGGGVGVPTASNRQLHAPDEVEDDDSHFVDVFSGSPVNSGVYPTEDYYKKDSNTVTSSPFVRSPGEYPSQNASFRGARKATTSFWPNRVHGGLIEEVTDVASLDDDDMFASIDPNDDRGVVGGGGRQSRGKSETFDDARDDDIEDYMDHSPIPAQSQLRVPSRRWIPAAGPDAAVEPLDNPFGTDDVWRYPPNASVQSQGRVSTALRERRGLSANNLRLDALREMDDDVDDRTSYSGRNRSGGMSLSRGREEPAFEDPWATHEAASTANSMRRR